MVFMYSITLIMFYSLILCRYKEYENNSQIMLQKSSDKAFNFLNISDRLTPKLRPRK